MTDQTALSGSRQILSRCLGLRSGQELLIFADETTVAVAATLAEAAYELDVFATTFFVPSVLQQRIPGETIFGAPIAMALREVRTIITCVNAMPECFPFRDHLLETERSVRTRIGHMPGANLDVLRMANVDFDALLVDCRNLERALIRGHTLVLSSYAANGQEHKLQVDIGGWNRLPIASTGIIPDGAWGNVPSGETYIAPIEGSANGSVVINGSIPGMVIGVSEEFVLHFECGRMVRVEPETSLAAQWLIATQIEPARIRRDPNWNNLAEIGIGVNPAVVQLTGNMLYDEKAAHTAHIALGSSTQMGGTVVSAIHCDMVIHKPSIVIDNKQLVRQGVLTYKERDWRENYQSITTDYASLNGYRTVARSVADTETKHGRLCRVLRSDSGRMTECVVGDDATATLAARLYNLLPAEGDALETELLISRSRLAKTTARQVLQVMRAYGLILIDDTQGARQ